MCSDSCLLSLGKSLSLAFVECQIPIDTWRHVPATASKFQIGTPVRESELLSADRDSRDLIFI